MENTDMEKNEINPPVVETKQLVMSDNGMQNNVMPVEESFFTKFPFLKKWWFWVASIGVIILVLGIIFFLL